MSYIALYQGTASEAAEKVRNADSSWAEAHSEWQEERTCTAHLKVRPFKTHGKCLFSAASLSSSVGMTDQLWEVYSLCCATVCTCARTRPSSRDRRSCSVAFCTCSCCFRPSISCRCAFICCCCGACGAPFMCEVDG